MKKNFTCTIIMLTILACFAFDERPLAAPQNLEAIFESDSVTLNWEAPDNTVLEESFDTEIPDNWSNIDNDGDGEMWFIYDLADVPHSGDACLASASWTSTAGALTPDNWLISPEIEISESSELHFWAAAQDPAYPADHYSVKISSEGTDLAYFTDEIYSETLEDDVWHEVVIDLNEYIGETINIAWQHHDVTDMFYMKIDDISVVNVASREVVFSENFDNSSSTNTFSTRSSLDRNLTGYNIYRNEAQYSNVSADMLTFTDTELPDQNLVTYYVTAVYDEGESNPSNTVNVMDEIDDSSTINSIELLGNYPNPFNPKTFISFNLIKSSHVTLEIFNLKGQKINTLVDETLAKGKHKIEWTGKDEAGDSMSSGMYFYKMKNGRYTSTKKLILIK